MEVCAAVLEAIDTAALFILPALAVWICLSGLDDLIPLAAAFWARFRTGDPLRAATWIGSAAPEQPIAIFVPLWREHRVIGRMIEHNVAAIRYSNYHFFIGAYPNDEPTLEAVRELERRYPHVHLSVCPHEGPTSKADCLNWIYQRMLEFEERREWRFGVIMTHDAEDLIHPQALPCINHYCADYDMVQVPVLPLPTPARMWTHGLYCDDFAEMQTRDMPAREVMGGFVPSSGVGTGFSRTAIERLAQTASNRIFEPECLTEDYENGLRIRLLGGKQKFVPLTRHDGSWIATREYFPHCASTAIRQRTRWVTGIALQTWQRHGWRGGLRQAYWLWRDRKGLVGSVVGLISNLLFAYGALTLGHASTSGTAWALDAVGQNPWLMAVLSVNLFLLCVHTSVRIWSSARIYGWGFASLAPFRAVYANWINSRAGINALIRFTRSRMHRKPLVWLKTEHMYPSRAALDQQPLRLLGEILVGSEYISQEQLTNALANQGTLRLGEYLLAEGAISEADLCEALALQYGLPSGRIEPAEVPPGIARSLPRNLVRDCRVLPVRVFSGDLFLACTDPPQEGMVDVFRSFTRLEIRFHLVTPSNLEELKEALL